MTDSTIIATAYTVLFADGSSYKANIDWPRQPGLDRIHALVEPLLGNEPAEHVCILMPPPRDPSFVVGDMFVSEFGALRWKDRNRLPENAAASEHYHRATLTRAPNARPGDLPTIHGIAIVFHRKVWF